MAGLKSDLHDRKQNVLFYYQKGFFYLWNCIFEIEFSYLSVQNKDPFSSMNFDLLGDISPTEVSYNVNIHLYHPLLWKMIMVYMYNVHMYIYLFICLLVNKFFHSFVCNYLHVLYMVSKPLYILTEASRNFFIVWFLCW